MVLTKRPLWQCNELRVKRVLDTQVQLLPKEFHQAVQAAPWPKATGKILFWHFSQRQNMKHLFFFSLRTLHIVGGLLSYYHSLKEFLLPGSVYLQASLCSERSSSAGGLIRWFLLQGWKKNSISVLSFVKAHQCGSHLVGLFCSICW